MPASLLNGLPCCNKVPHLLTCLLGRLTFLFNGGRIFNEVPLNTTKSKNLQKFCRRARNFFSNDESAFEFFLTYSSCLYTFLKILLLYLGF